MVDLAYVFAGFFVGTIVGLTGVGGGSLMTPLLICFFDRRDRVAGALPMLPLPRIVATDIAYAVPLTLTDPPHTRPRDPLAAVRAARMGGHQAGTDLIFFHCC